MDLSIRRGYRLRSAFRSDAVVDRRLVLEDLLVHLELAKISGLVTQPFALPQETQITRLVCVEGWSAIGKWTGARLSEFLRRIGADMTAKYVHFAFAGGTLPTKFGFPMRIRMPTKLGFKNPKHVIGLAVLNNYTGGYWEDRGYNWFSGL